MVLQCLVQFGQEVVTVIGIVFPGILAVENEADRRYSPQRLAVSDGTDAPMQILGAFVVVGAVVYLGAGRR